MAWMPWVNPSRWRSPTMKNFDRLVRFAWPYRAQFGLSLVCAVLVACLWCANISAVYPLLKILINSENCQQWIAQKIYAMETERLAQGARLEEVEFIRAAADLNRPRVKDHFRAVDRDQATKERVIAELKRRVELAPALGDPKRAPPDPSTLHLKE